MISQQAPIVPDRRASRPNLSIHPDSQPLPDQLHSLPPLKSPRGHLLDRIRSTPRSARFVPQAAPAANVTDEAGMPSTPRSKTVANTNAKQAYATPPLSQSKRYPTADSWQYKQDPARGDQVVMLEQQLRVQNDLLIQQQALLQQMQRKQQQQFQSPTSNITPPYTPQAAEPYSQHCVSTNMDNVVYDPNSGQYYMLAPSQGSAHFFQTPEFSYNVTPPQKPAYLNKKPNSFGGSSMVSRSTTPPKDGQPTRQPRGPPAIELLSADKDGSLNFSSRSRKRITKILEAGLLRRRNSPALPEVVRPSSRASMKSNGSLGPIEESFPLIKISSDKS